MDLADGDSDCGAESGKGVSSWDSPALDVLFGFEISLLSMTCVKVFTLRSADFVLKLTWPESFRLGIQWRKGGE